VLPSTSAVGLTTEASAAWPNALGKLTRDLESVLGSKVVGLVRERTSKAVSAGLWWWLFGENGEPVDVELTVQMIRRYWAQSVSLFRQGAGRLRSRSAVVSDRRHPADGDGGGGSYRLISAGDVELLAGSVAHGTAVE
jgi:hypothetical protein